MIQSFRQLKNRIRSVENTRKITRAMEMVSAAKLNRVKGTFLQSKPYLTNTERVLFNLLSDEETVDHPALEERKVKNNIGLVVIASDTGLCSTYNNNVLRVAKEFANHVGKSKIRIIAVGKEALSYFKKEGYAVEESYIGMRGKFSPDVALEISQTLTAVFLSHKCDEIHIAYTHFSPNLRHKPVVEDFLPIRYERKKKQYYLLEPGRETILNDLVSRYLLDKVRVILLDAFTAEHSARMLAMKLATDNADELIDTLTLMKNKARQFAITKEVLEIAMSAEALKG